jgi:hypothetical protein
VWNTGKQEVRDFGEQEIRDTFIAHGMKLGSWVTDQKG